MEKKVMRIKLKWARHYRRKAARAKNQAERDYARAVAREELAAARYWFGRAKERAA